MESSSGVDDTSNNSAGVETRSGATKRKEHEGLSLRSGLRDKSPKSSPAAAGGGLAEAGNRNRLPGASRLPGVTRKRKQESAASRAAGMDMSGAGGGAAGGSASGSGEDGAGARARRRAGAAAGGAGDGEEAAAGGASAADSLASGALQSLLRKLGGGSFEELFAPSAGESATKGALFSASGRVSTVKNMLPFVEQAPPSWRRCWPASGPRATTRSSCR